jgi:hypothetical protein
MFFYNGVMGTILFIVVVVWVMIVCVKGMVSAITDLIIAIIRKSQE